MNDQISLEEALSKLVYAVDNVIKVSSNQDRTISFLLNTVASQQKQINMLGEEIDRLKESHGPA